MANTDKLCSHCGQAPVVTVVCPKCRQTITTHAGMMKIRCPGCSELVVVPGEKTATKGTK